jgi:hypothetical protein
MRRSRATIDPGTFIAMGGLLAGWFFMASLVTDLGLLQQSVCFYELLGVVNDPAGRLSGVNASQPLATFAFGVLCIAAIAAPILPLFWRRRIASLGYFVPLVLMVAGFALLYAKTSAAHAPVDDSAHSLSAYLARAAAKAAARAGDYAATRISIGAGTYVAFLSCCYLAFRGVRNLRMPRVASSQPSPQGRER